jgi:hypothetical protein
VSTRLPQLGLTVELTRLLNTAWPLPNADQQIRHELGPGSHAAPYSLMQAVGMMCGHMFPSA